MKVDELKKMSVSELRKELNELLREQFDLRVQRATQQLDKTHLMKASRKKIARVKTILSEQLKKDVGNE